MCLAVPMKVKSISGQFGVVELEGNEYDVRLDLVPDAGVSDYVLVHAGVAINKVDEDDAVKTLEIFSELDRLDAEEHKA